MATFTYLWGDLLFDERFQFFFLAMESNTLLDGYNSIQLIADSDTFCIAFYLLYWYENTFPSWIIIPFLSYYTVFNMILKTLLFAKPLTLTLNNAAFSSEITESRCITQNGFNDVYSVSQIPVCNRVINSIILNHPGWSWMFLYFIEDYRI